MYLRLFLDSFERKLGGVGNGGFLRSFTVTGLVIVLLIVGATAAYIEHGRGNIQKIKKHLGTPATVEPTSTSPGGLDPVILTRAKTPNANQPEFLSATLLPGRGMNVLQIKAFIPGLGEINLLDAPSLETAARAMSGVDDDSEGQASLVDGAAFLVPWAGRLAGITSIDGKSSSVTWKGQILNLPANSIQTATPAAYGGLLLSDPANSVQTELNPDGGSTKAVFNSVDVDDRWPSNPETTVSVRLTGRSIEMTVNVKNTGDSLLPVGVGWAPRFLIPSGDRSKATLHLPATMHSQQRDVSSGMPNGVLEPVSRSRDDFSPRGGTAIGDRNLDDTFVHLNPNTDPDAAIELRDPLSKFGLRITPLSASIKAIHVFSPSGSSFVSISPQMNFDDPWGRQWSEREDTGMAELVPGQTVQWKILLELFPIGPPARGPSAKGPTAKGVAAR
jgi:aldose 1-epimerase